MAFQVISNLLHLYGMMHREMHLNAGFASPAKANQLEMLQTGLSFRTTLLPKACAPNCGLWIVSSDYYKFIPLRYSWLRQGCPVPFFPLHSLPFLCQFNGESTHLERGLHIFQSLLSLAGFQVHVICLLDTCSICCPLLPWGQMALNPSHWGFYIVRSGSSDCWHWGP